MTHYNMLRSLASDNGILDQVDDLIDDKIAFWQDDLNQGLVTRNYVYRRVYSVLRRAFPDVYRRHREKPVTACARQ